MGKKTNTKSPLEKTLSSNFNERVYNYFLDKTKEKRFQERVANYKKLRAKMNPMQFRAELSVFCMEYGLDPYLWIDILDNYINKGVIPRADENYSLPATVFDAKSTKYFDKEAYPVLMAISPIASQRELISYLKSFYNVRIKPLQEKSKASLTDSPAKTRKKKTSIRERNEFIYQHRTLPRKEIMKLVSDHFGEYLDYGHIGKVISLEKSKRENK